MTNRSGFQIFQYLSGLFKTMGKKWDDLKPAVNKTVLVLIAGLVWVIVGGFLSRLAILWWQHYTGSFLILLVILGLLLGIIKAFYVFGSIVRKNLSRIARMERNGFVLAFIPWKTYFLIAGMMTLGILLRHSSFPKQYLAVVYLAVGIAMIISSFQYFKRLFRNDLDVFRSYG